MIELKLHRGHPSGLATKGVEARFARILLIPEVVQHPIMVLKGWNREGFDDALIYVGKPSTDYRGIQIETPPPKSMLFLVFVTPDYIISDWRWEKADPDDPFLPENMQNRCERVLWPTNPPS